MHSRHHPQGADDTALCRGDQVFPKELSILEQQGGLAAMATERPVTKSP
jgi:hypothetical protein